MDAAPGAIKKKEEEKTLCPCREGGSVLPGRGGGSASPGALLRTPPDGKPSDGRGLRLPAPLSASRPLQGLKKYSGHKATTPPAAENAEGIQPQILYENTPEFGEYFK